MPKTNVRFLEDARHRKVVQPRTIEVQLSEEDKQRLADKVIDEYVRKELLVPCPFCGDGHMLCKPKRGDNPRPFGQCRECHSQMHLNSSQAEAWFVERAIAFMAEKERRERYG